MPDTVQSLCGYPLEDIVAIALEKTRGAEGDNVVAIAVVDMDGHELLNSSVRQGTSGSSSKDASETAPGLGELISPDRLLVLFDQSDRRLLASCLPDGLTNDIHVFSLSDEYAKAHGYVDTVADIARSYGHNTAAEDVLAQAQTLAKCFRSLMGDTEYTSHQAHMELGGSFSQRMAAAAAAKAQEAKAAEAAAAVVTIETPEVSADEPAAPLSNLDKTLVLPVARSLADAMKPEPEPEPEQELMPEPEPEPEVVPEPELETKPEPEPDAVPEPEPEPASEAEVEPAPVIIASTEVDANPADIDVEAVREVEVEPLPEPESDTELASETEGMDELEDETACDNDPEDVAEAEVESIIEAETDLAVADLTDATAEEAVEVVHEVDEAVAAVEPDAEAPSAAEPEKTAAEIADQKPEEKPASKKPAAKPGKIQKAVANPLDKLKALPRNTQIIILAAVAFALLLVVCLVSLTSCPRSQDDRSLASDFDGLAETHTYFDEVVVHVPSTWEVNDSDERWVNIYPTNDGYIFIQGIENEDAEPATEETCWESFLKGLESDGTGTVDREGVEELNIGDALRNRYPITMDLGYGSFGGYMDVTLTGSNVYCVVYTYLNKEPEDVRDVTCAWLDDVQYLSTEEPAFVVDEMVLDELEADTTTLSHAGFSVELPSTWHNFERDDGEKDRYWFRNSKGCLGFIEYDKGAAAEEDTFKSAKESYLKGLSDDFDVDEDSVRDVKVGKAKGFVCEAIYDSETPYATTYEVVYSGDDMYVLYLGIPEDKAKGMESIIENAIKSVEVFGSKAPNFKNKDEEKKDSDDSKDKDESEDKDKDKESDSKGSESKTSGSTTSRTTSSQTPSATTTTTQQTPTQTTTQTQTQPSTTTTTQSSTPRQTQTQTQTQTQETQPNQQQEEQNSSSNETESQLDALSTALAHLSAFPFSYDGLVSQLERDGFTFDDATWATDRCDVNWDDQAINMAQYLLQNASYSYQGLEDQLRYEGFTDDQARYGAEHCGTDWYALAYDQAYDYLSNATYDFDELVNQLESDGFTYEQAVYGVNAAGL